ncbi:hypothetical protein ACA910_000860 [Epithemia clementina (nom. ined.)]
MASKGTPERSYTATADELNGEIKSYLEKNPNAEAKEVRSYLLRTKKDWIVPDKRVAKFLKRQKMGKPIAGDEEESVMSGGPIRRFFSGTSTRSVTSKDSKQSKTSTSKQPTPKKEEKTPPPSEPEPSAATKTKEVERPVEETKEEPQEEAIPVEAADANDHKKIDCCTGCVIL